MISVIVPFTKSERCVLDCLASIYRVDYPMERLEVIAVDDGLDDEIAEEIRERFPTVRVLRNPSPLGCDGSKQAGMDAATGSIIAMTDADCTVHPMWAGAIADGLSGETQVLCGPVRHPKTLLREVVGIADFPDSQWDDHREVRAFPGCNMAARTEALRASRYHVSGGMRFGSDRLSSWRMHREGYCIRYDPRMEVFHFPAVTIGNLVERRLRYGRKAVALRLADPSLPGSALGRMGPLAVPAYVGYRTAKDAQRVFSMARRRLVNPWHIPLLLPILLLFRLLDAVGVLTYRRLAR